MKIIEIIAFVSMFQHAQSFHLGQVDLVHRNRLIPKRSIARFVDPGIVTDIPITFEPRGVTAQDTVVFIIGCAPFAVATVEFWRRIAVGASFGTGTDSVIIGEDNNPESSRGQRILGKVRVMKI